MPITVTMEIPEELAAAVVPSGVSGNTQAGVMGNIACSAANGGLFLRTHCTRMVLAVKQVALKLHRINLLDGSGPFAANPSL